MTIPLRKFLNDYGENLAERVSRDLTVVHDSLKEKEPEISFILNRLKKAPFPSQAEIIKGTYKSFMTGNKAVYTVCEMGTGKTLMAIAVAYLLHEKNNLKRVLVMCPPHLVLKWMKEIEEALPKVKVYNLNGKNVLGYLEKFKNNPKPKTLEFYVIGRERAKTGYLWRPAPVIRKNGFYCPKCGQELLDNDNCPLDIFQTNNQGKVIKRHSCQNRTLKWIYDKDQGIHKKSLEICGEQLWQPDLSKRKYRKAIPARFIKKKMKAFFDLLIADEVHMYKNQSGQGYAFGALSSAVKYILCLTGTLAGGYCSDVYHLLFRTHPQLMLEDKNLWGNPKKFIERYGILEKITTVRQEDGLTTKAKRTTTIKEKPGISPLLLGKFLLSHSVFMRLADCIDRLQPYEEEVIELPMDPDMAYFYDEFEHTLKTALLQALAIGDNSLLGGYLHALLSYPERISTGIEVVHPHTKEVVAYGPPLDGMMPKELELIMTIKEELKENRKVLVYFQNSATTDISPRLVQMMEDEGIKVKVLRSGDTEGRAELIDSWVQKGIDVLMTNPKKVEVGMDLLDFPTIIFYQIPMSTYTLRQASRRSWRIPQTKPVKVYFFTYSETLQTKLMKLMADKLTSSLALEGELTDKGLAALSDTSDSMAKELAKILLEKGEKDDKESLKDIWADFRKREVQIEEEFAREINAPEVEILRISEEASANPSLEIETSTEIDQIGGKLVKVKFTEYTGKRKKVTHIEISESDLDQMIEQSTNMVQAQYTLF